MPTCVDGITSGALSLPEGDKLMRVSVWRVCRGLSPTRGEPLNLRVKQYQWYTSSGEVNTLNTNQHLNIEYGQNESSDFQVSTGATNRNSRSATSKPPPGAVNLERSYQICQAVIQNSPNRDQLRCQLKPPPSLLTPGPSKRLEGRPTQYGVVTSSRGGSAKPFTPPLGGVRPGGFHQRQPSPPVVVRHMFTSQQGIPVTMAVLPQPPPTTEMVDSPGPQMGQYILVQRTGGLHHGHRAPHLLTTSNKWLQDAAGRRVWTQSTTVVHCPNPGTQAITRRDVPYGGVGSEAVAQSYTLVGGGDGQTVMEGGGGPPRNTTGAAMTQSEASPCACNLNAMIMCKKCGAFCHDDCISPARFNQYTSTVFFGCFRNYRGESNWFVWVFPELHREKVTGLFGCFRNYRGESNWFVWVFPELQGRKTTGEKVTGLFGCFRNYRGESNWFVWVFPELKESKTTGEKVTGLFGCFQNYRRESNWFVWVFPELQERKTTGGKVTGLFGCFQNYRRESNWFVWVFPELHREKVTGLFGCFQNYRRESNWFVWVFPKLQEGKTTEGKVTGLFGCFQNYRRESNWFVRVFPKLQEGKTTGEKVTGLFGCFQNYRRESNWFVWVFRNYRRESNWFVWVFLELQERKAPVRQNMRGAASTLLASLDLSWRSEHAHYHCVITLVRLQRYLLLRLQFVSLELLHLGGKHGFWLSR
uniref:Protein ASX-like PHD domain-containing protein n=1 Tax=Timema monikensis TaxID=170555 RepID=A0A7R9EJD8_9NEOP|nr:unnamed protein product [Timema monikensis]